ncbi:MAG: lysophospholipid acyltransferase family protein [Roseobacter sp.]
MAKAPPSFSKKATQYITNLAIVGIIRIALSLPYAMRVRLVGRIMQHFVGPIAGYRKRALTNLELIWPDKPIHERRRIASMCLNNVGRTLIENYSNQDFPKRLAQNPLTGPGFDALENAARENQPVILVTGHYGNYEAVRAALAGRGYAVGGLYRNMRNPYFNAHYVHTMEAFGGPVFPQGRTGTKGFVRHLKKGGQLVLLFDQHVRHAPVMEFMGRPALTAVSAAELSLRYNALLIPFYGIRQSDGLSFETVMETPITPSTPEEMTQAVTDSLSRRVSQDPAQWFWVHRRWRFKKTKA